MFRIKNGYINKGISSAVSAVIIATISITLVGTTYLFSKSLTESAMAETFEIVDIFQNRIIVRNTGTQPIKSFKTLIDGKEVDNEIKDPPIQPRNIGTVNISLEGISPGRHRLTLISRSMSQTWMWEIKLVETTTSTTTTTTTTTESTSSTSTTIPCTDYDGYNFNVDSYCHDASGYHYDYCSASYVYDWYCPDGKCIKASKYCSYGCSGDLCASPTTSTTIPAIEIDLFLNGTQGDFYYQSETYANFTVVANETALVNLTTNIAGWIDQSSMSPLYNISLITCDVNDTWYEITGFTGDNSYLWDSETHYAICYVTTTIPCNCYCAESCSDRGLCECYGCNKDICINGYPCYHKLCCEECPIPKPPKGASIEANVETEQGTAEIGKTVKWTSKISVMNPSSVDIEDYSIRVVIPEDVSNIRIRDEEEKTVSKETSIAVSMASNETKNYILEYETPAPYKVERVIDTIVDWRKIVTVVSEYNYSNVKTYTDIVEAQIKAIKLYWFVSDDIIDVTEDPAINLTFVDTNSNGLIDELEWITPHTSNQTFEIRVTSPEFTYGDQGFGTLAEDDYEHIYDYDSCGSSHIDCKDALKNCYGDPIWCADETVGSCSLPNCGSLPHTSVLSNDCNAGGTLPKDTCKVCVTPAQRCLNYLDCLVSGNCDYQCDGTWRNCDLSPGNGCECDTDNDENCCGSCTIQCNAGQTCENGVCKSGIGGPCNSGNDCAVGICVDGTCRSQCYDIYTGKGCSDGGDPYTNDGICTRLEVGAVWICDKSQATYVTPYHLGDCRDPDSSYGNECDPDSLAGGYEAAGVCGESTHSTCCSNYGTGQTSTGNVPSVCGDQSICNDRDGWYCDYVGDVSWSPGDKRCDASDTACRTCYFGTKKDNEGLCESGCGAYSTCDEKNDGEYCSANNIADHTCCGWGFGDNKCSARGGINNCYAHQNCNDKNPNENCRFQDDFCDSNNRLHEYDTDTSNWDNIKEDGAMKCTTTCGCPVGPEEGSSTAYCDTECNPANTECNNKLPNWDCRDCFDYCDGSLHILYEFDTDDSNVDNNLDYGHMECGQSCGCNSCPSPVSSCDIECGADSGCDTKQPDTCPTQGYYCNNICGYKDRDEDQPSCEATGTGCIIAYSWNSIVEYELGTNPSCCGDDAIEQRTNRICVNGACESSDTDWCCANETNKCAYNDQCYENGYVGDVDSDSINEKCLSGTWIENPPQWSDNSTDSTYAGKPVEFRLKWTDDYGLSGYIFSLDNGNGLFVNDTWTQWFPFNTTIFDDGFEVDITTNWTATGSWDIATDQVHSGINSSKMPAKGTIGNLQTKSVDTSDSLVIYIDFWYRDDDVDEVEMFLEYNDSSGNWDDIKNLGEDSTNPPEDQWNNYVEKITDPQYFHSGFVIRFRNPVALAATENFWVDDVKIMHETQITEAWSNITKVVNETSGTTIQWRVYANDTNDNWNYTEPPFSFETTPYYGWLNVTLINPDPSVYDESYPLKVTQYETFTVNATVKCEGPGVTCGSISGGVRYNDTGSSMTLINTTEGAKPMFVIGGTEEEQGPPFYYDDDWSFSVASEGGSSGPMDIEFNGTYFWIILLNGTLLRYDANGNYDNWAVDLSSDAAISDTTWDCLDFNGTTFFACGNTNDEVYAFNEDGTYTGWSFDISGTVTNPAAIVFNGTYFWVQQSVSGDDDLYIFYANGTYTGDYWKPDAADPGGEVANDGIDFDGTYFYISEVLISPKRVYKYDDEGNNMYWNFSTSPTQTFVYGISRSSDGKYFWCLDYIDKEVRRYAHNTTPGAANPISLDTLDTGDSTQVNFTINTTSFGIYKIDVNSSSSVSWLENHTDDAYVKIIDINSPQWSDNSTNSTYAGEDVEFRLRWTDGGGLSGYIFSFIDGTNGTTVYNFSNTNNKAYNNSVDNEPPSSLTPAGEVEFSSEAYTNISASDNTYFETNNTSSHPYHKFNITIDESVNSIKEINVSWEGHTISDGIANLHVYNFTSGGWDSYLTSNSGESDFWLNKSFTSGFEDLINSDKMSILVQDPTDWADPNCNYRRLSSFNNPFGAQNLTNFTIMVLLNSTRIDYSKTNQTDIRFYDNDNSTILKHHWEVWNESGDSFGWVKIPLLENSSTDYIWIYYNCSDDATQNEIGTYDDNYVGIWHLNETSGDAHDSTSYSNDGTVSGATQGVSGKANGAYSFSGVDGQQVALSNLAVSTTSGAKTTVQFWMYWTGTNSQMPFGWTSYDLWFYGGSFGFNTAGGDIWGISSSGLANEWKHVVAIFNNGDAKLNQLYINGVNQALSQQYGTTGSRNVATTAKISGWNNGNTYKFGGTIDEASISNVSRSASWINASYLTMSDGFITYGSEEEKVTGGKVATDFIEVKVKGKDWVNDTWNNTDWNSIEEWSNVTKIIIGKIGAMIYWKVYANDTDNNWNISDTFSFNTTEPPIIPSNVIDVHFNVSSFYYNNPIECIGNVSNQKYSVTHVYYSVWDDDSSEDNPNYSGELNLETDCEGSSWSTGKNCTAVIDNVQGSKGDWNCSIIANNLYSDNVTGYASTPVIMLNTPPTKPNITQPANETKLNKYSPQPIAISCTNTTSPADVNLEDSLFYIIRWFNETSGTWDIICTPTDGDCNWNWWPAADQQNYTQIKCNLDDTEDESEDSDLIHIEMDRTDPICILEPPENYQILESPYTLNGTYSDYSGISNVTYYNVTNDVFEKIGTSYTLPDYQYSWYVPDELEDNMNVSIMAVCYDNFDNSANDTVTGIIVDMNNIAPQIWNLKVRNLTDYPIDEVWPRDLVLITANVSDPDPVRNISYIECNFTDVTNGNIKLFNLTEAYPGHDYTHNESLFIKYYWGPGQGWVNVTVYDTDSSYSKATINITIFEGYELILHNAPINFSTQIPSPEDKEAIEKQGWPLIIKNYGNTPINISQAGGDYLIGITDPSVKIVITNITWNQTATGSFSELTNYDEIINETLQPDENQSVYYKMKIPALKPQDYGGLVTYSSSKA